MQPHICICTILPFFITVVRMDERGRAYFIRGCGLCKPVWSLFFFKTDSNNKYIAGISNRFVVYKQCVLHLPAAWHAAKELRSADHSHLMVGQSSNNRIHTHT